ncbi:hypothetical protein [Microbacterium sp. NPDC056234]
MDQHIFRPQTISDAEEGIVTIGIDLTGWLDAVAGDARSTDQPEGRGAGR